jgi:hypothetical protein
LKAGFHFAAEDTEFSEAVPEGLGKNSIDPLHQSQEGQKRRPLTKDLPQKMLPVLRRAVAELDDHID